MFVTSKPLNFQKCYIACSDAENKLLGLILCMQTSILKKYRN